MIFSDDYDALWARMTKAEARVAELEKAICTALDLLPVHLRDAQAALREIVSVPSVSTDEGERPIELSDEERSAAVETASRTHASRPLPNQRPGVACPDGGDEPVVGGDSRPGGSMGAERARGDGGDIRADAAPRAPSDVTGGPRTSEAKHTDQKLSQAAAASFEAGWNGALEHVRQQQRTGQAEAGDLLAKAIGYLNRWFDVSYITPNTPLTWHEGDAEVHALVDLLRPASAPGPCPPEAQVNWDAEIEKTTLKRCRTLLRQVFQYFVKGEGGYLVPHTISTELAEQIQMFGGGAPCFPAAYFADIENGTASPDLSDIEMPCAGGCGATTLRGLGLCGKCMAREMVPDPRPTQARSMPEVVAAEDLDGFKRTEPDDDHSTIHCPCGSSFTWTGLDLGLGPWVNKHMPHQQRTTKPVPGRDDFEAKAAEWLKRGNCTKQDCARCISALAAMLRDVYSEGLRDGPRLDADAQRPDYARPKLSPTKTSAEARRRITAKIRPFALDFLNSTDIEDADRVSALVHLLVMVWDEAFETCAAMPCEHDQRSETATPLNHHASCPVHDGGNCACAKGTGK